MTLHKIMLLSLVVVVTNGYNCTGNISDINFHREVTGVRFEPLITFEDSGHTSWYDDSGLKVLLKQIHSKFDKVMISYSASDNVLGGYILTQEYPSSSIPLIAARMNKKNKMENEITSSLEIIIVCFNTFTEIATNFSKIQRVVNQANEIFPGTVKKIIYPNSTSIFLDECTSTSWNGVENVQFSGESNTFLITSEYTDDISQISYHQKRLIQCTDNIRRQDSGASIIFILIATGISSTGVTNYSRLINYHIKMDQWAKRTNSFVIINSAFDTKIWFSKAGWWRVKPSGLYKHPSQFIFEEKACLSENLRDDELVLSLNLTWLQQELKFGSSYTSFVLNPYEFNKNLANNACHISCFKKYFKFLSSRGVKNVYVYPMRPSYKNLGQNIFNSFLDAVAAFNSEGHEPIHLNLGLTKSMFSETIRKANQVNKQFAGTVQSLVEFPEKEDRSFDLINRAVSHNRDENISFGYIVPIDECVQKLNGSYTTIEFIKYHLNHFIVAANTLFYEHQRGFDIIFQEFKAKVNVCKAHLTELNVTAKIMFLTSWQRPKDLNDQYNFVMYWENVIEWAEQTNTHVILASVFDRENMGGWWIPLKNVTGIEKLELETQKESLYKKVVEERIKLENSTILEADTSKAWLYGIIGAAAFVCVIVIPVITAIVLVRRKRILTRIEMDEFFKGAEGSDGPNGQLYDREKYEIDKGSFSISEEILGSGSHGNVFLGRAHENQVAVKIGSNAKTKAKLLELLVEIKILAYLGKHENIVELIGVNTCKLRTGNIFVFLELCGLGSLEKYLKRKRNEHNETADGIMMMDMDFFSKLMKWVLDIARGMEYVASKKIVHLDLAARNILLTDNEQVKISDFCLSQYISGTYVVTNEDALPWRWMALECFSNFGFTEKSDVWAFGVTLWEMFTLGELPYGGGQSFNEEFTTALAEGHRLAPPLYNRCGIYEVMKSCWHEEPEERPAFEDLVFTLEEIKEVNEARNEVGANASNYYVL